MKNILQLFQQLLVCTEFSSIISKIFIIVPTIQSTKTFFDVYATLGYQKDYFDEFDYAFLSRSTYVHSVEPFVELVASTGLKSVYYVVMLFFTADRLVHAILCLRYPVYWSIRKTKYLLMITWAFGVLSSIVVSLSVVYADFDWQVCTEVLDTHVFRYRGQNLWGKFF